jgi:GH24 family phage-related lysozyme (muramidase)
MGLLDNANWNDPILAMAAGLLGSQTLGQGLSRGLLGGMQAEQQAQQNQMRQLLFQSQMEENQAQTEERRAKLAEAQRLRQAQEAFAASFRAPASPQAAPGFNMRDPSTWQKLPYGGTTPGAAEKLPDTGGPMTAEKLPMGPGQQQAPQLSPEFVLRGLNAGYTIDQLKAMVESNNWGRPEVARTVEGVDAKGNPVTLQFDKFGNQISNGVAKPVERKTLDIGGSIQDRNPYTGEVYGTTPKTMTPGETASNAVARGNLAVAQGNLGVARAGLDLRRQESQQGKWQYDPARGGLVNIGTGEFKPATQNGVPIGAKESPITESQANANIYASRATEANRILAEIGGAYQPAKINAQQALASTPLVGGVLGWAGNKALTDNDQMVAQAQRDFINAVLRKESGAVIAQSEFDNAAKQYFPQPGDSEAVIVQKARNRETALRGLVVAAGPAMGRNQPPDAGGWKYLGKE